LQLEELKELSASESSHHSAEKPADISKKNKTQKNQTRRIWSKKNIVNQTSIYDKASKVYQQNKLMSKKSPKSQTISQNQSATCLKTYTDLEEKTPNNFNQSFKTIGNKNFSYYANTVYRPESSRCRPESAVQYVELNLVDDGPTT
jgi:RecA/RadA recombinase